jgi:hypothetical protein
MTEIAKIATPEILEDMGIQRERVTFPNGRGVSIIRGYGTYGSKESGLFEVAVLDLDGDLDFSTPVTDDVLGWQSVQDVLDVMLAVSKLPGREVEAPAVRRELEA